MITKSQIRQILGALDSITDTDGTADIDAAIAILQAALDAPPKIRLSSADVTRIVHEAADAVPPSIQRDHAIARAIEAAVMERTLSVG